MISEATFLPANETLLASGAFQVLRNFGPASTDVERQSVIRSAVAGSRDMRTSIACRLDRRRRNLIPSGHSEAPTDMRGLCCCVPTKAARCGPPTLAHAVLFGTSTGVLLN